MTLLLVTGPLPEQIILPAWAQWVVLIAALTVAVRTLWVKVVQPLSRTLVLAENTLPVLKEIQVHFQPNGGYSLYDVVTDTQKQVTEVRARVDGLQTRQREIYDQINPPVTVDREEVLESLIAQAVDRATRKARRKTDAPPPPPKDDF